MAQSWTESYNFFFDDDLESSDNSLFPRLSTHEETPSNELTSSSTSSSSSYDYQKEYHHSRASEDSNSYLNDTSKSKNDETILYQSTLGAKDENGSKTEISSSENCLEKNELSKKRTLDNLDLDSSTHLDDMKGHQNLASSDTVLGSSDDSFTSLKESSPTSSRRSSHPSMDSSAYRTRCSGLQVEDMATSGLWVFGYGSLCWHQGFDYSDSKTGFVLGFSRRFWQGNVTHRGTDNKPGRVATLVEESEGIVWGQAFQVRGEAALPYLNNRECELGGYRTTLATFHPRDGSAAFPAVLYVATPNNRHWLGDEPLASIADQIVESKGPSGHNVEYLLRLAEFLREHVPEAIDDHVFGLEALVRDRVVIRQMCLRTLMGDTPTKAPVAVAVMEQQVLQPVPSTSSQFSNRVPSKKLRCVNI